MAEPGTPRRRARKLWVLHPASLPSLVRDLPPLSQDGPVTAPYAPSHPDNESGPIRTRLRGVSQGNWKRNTPSLSDHGRFEDVTLNILGKYGCHMHRCPPVSAEVENKTERHRKRSSTGREPGSGGPMVREIAPRPQRCSHPNPQGLWLC